MHPLVDTAADDDDAVGKRRTVHQRAAPALYEDGGGPDAVVSPDTATAAEAVVDGLVRRRGCAAAQIIRRGPRPVVDFSVFSFGHGCAACFFMDAPLFALAVAWCRPTALLLRRPLVVRLQGSDWRESPRSVEIKERGPL